MRRFCCAGLLTGFFFAVSALGQPALAQFTQQGTKLVGTGAVGAAQQGNSVAVSSNGNTAIVGGFNDASVGAAWIYTRSGSTWTQQGPKLVGTGAVGNSRQGYGVAISADGNTAIVGGYNDNTGVGAAWIYVRSGGVWTQQGSKLVGTGGVGASNQGNSVALSADGNTAVLGSVGDNTNVGATWVFVRSGTTWTQQGTKLIGTGAVDTSNQGNAISLSADGNTFMVGGVGDNSFAGASWIFIRTGTTWSQQGTKLVGTGFGAGSVVQGGSVALSADGNTAIHGGTGDSLNVGAAWVFTRSGTTWTQQGSKLVGTGATGNAIQGSGVSLSSNGNIAIVGAYNDNSGAGAAWVYTRSGTTWTQQGSKLVGTGGVGGGMGHSASLSADGKTAFVGGRNDNSSFGAAWAFAQPGAGASTATHDFNGDGKSDIAWRLNTGEAADWLMNGTTIAASANLGSVSFTWTVAGQRDFNGDGNADWLWRDNAGNVAIWFMNGTAITSSAIVGNVSFDWTIVGTGDFDGDGKGDILWRHTDGTVAIWLMNGSTIASSAILGSAPNSWTIAGTGDFDGNGKSDVLWRDTAGNVVMWMMNGTAIGSIASVANVGTSWSIVGTGDLDGDGKNDIVWRDTSGTVAIWLMNGATLTQGGSLGMVATSWLITQTGDYNGDGKSDLLWRDAAGNVAVRNINGVALASAASVANVGLNWTIQGMNAD